MTVEDRQASTASRNQRAGRFPASGYSARDDRLTWPIALSYVLFFLSGAAALICELSWSRQLGLLFGQTAEAAALTLAAYFAGLAGGYALGARWSRRWAPLRGYGWAELIAAAWACLVPSLLDVLRSRHVLQTLDSLPPSVRVAVEGGLCLLVLLPTTTALGVTLPLMSEHLAATGGGRRVTLAYAVNTMGAVTGVVAATLVLIVSVGVRGSNYTAAALSALSGIGALMLSARPNRRRSESAAQIGPPQVSTSAALPRDDGRRDGDVWPYWIAGLSGFAILALEVLYTRLFALVFHNSTYTFGAVIAGFLLALSLGALLVSLAGRRLAAATLVTASGLLAAVAVPLSAVLFLQVTGLDYFEGGDTFAAYLLRATGLISLVILPPVVAAGVLLPAAWDMIAPTRPGGDVVGRLTTVNTLAAAMGAVAAAFLLLPVAGLWQSFAAVAALFGLSAAAALIRQRRRAVAVLVTLAAVLIPAAFIRRFHLERLETEATGSSLVRRWQSPYGWIDVARGRRGELQVRQNLHYRHGATGTSAAREYRQAHLPLLLHPRPQDVLTLGLGTGLTAGAAAVHPGVERVQVVELIPEVVEAARLLGGHNFGVVDRPNVDVDIADARQYLLVTQRRFDVIISDLFVPWESRTGYLYTVEHYRTARGRLRPGGLFCQWLALYQLGPREFELIADSFTSVFPHVTLWWGQMESNRPIVALIGAEQPPAVESEAINGRFQALRQTQRPADPYMDTTEQLADLSIGRWPERDSARLNTDEHPRVEFLAPVSLGAGALLQGRRLEFYFDRVLSRLPRHKLPLGPQDRDAHRQRLARQRFILFGVAERP